MGFAYDPASGAAEVLGDIRDPSIDDGCYRTHDCALIGDALYVAETDNPRRGCYLWRCIVQ